MGKAPSAPDPVKTIAQQTASNKETAISQAGLNYVNQSGPNGSLTYDQIGQWADGTPRFQATTALSDAGKALQTTGEQTSQNLANVARDQSGRLGSLLNRELDFSGLPQGGQWQNKDYSADRKRVEDGLFSRLNPQIDRQRQEFETSLVNRGIRPGSTAYDQQMSQFGQNVNDQRTSILLQGGQEQSRMQGMDLNSFGAQNTQRANALNELMTQRSQPLNEILALAGGSQVQTPQFGNVNSPQMAGTDIGGITNSGYANQMNEYNANQKLYGGLFDAGSNLLMLSDRRAKKNIVRIGQTDAGTPLYKFDYIHGGPTQIGVMAQDLLETQPGAVSMGTDGFYRVNYSEVE